ncbi:MAG: S8 family serine peptidase [Euryarchaeota archaeon]|nr:S8 family serine peptidase [Euryarchaeota archaeon]
MRGCKGVAIILLLLLSLTTPFASSLSIENQWNESKEEIVDGDEVILIQNHTWTSQEWIELELMGIQPLRQVNFNSLLVWKPVNIIVPQKYFQEESPKAIWKNSIENQFPQNGGAAVVVLEANLPIVILNKINNKLIILQLTDSNLNDNIVKSPISTAINIEWPTHSNSNNANNLLNQILEWPGVLWVEEEINANSRNRVAASIIQNNQMTQHPLWHLGLNGENIILSIADTGIDRDHSCFRNSSGEEGLPSGQNATGTPGAEHRKILLLNETIDEWDTIGEADGRHGTHTAGSLGCYVVHDQLTNQLEENMENINSISYASKLIIQDLVNSNGWIEPPMDGLLWEMAVNGGVIHSDSWGDATTAYTQRSSNLDAWVKENPWSIIFVAPGNNGGQLMEPANARSVVAVGATNNDNGTGMYSISSHGPTDEGVRGIFIVAPGVSILSAKADSEHTSNNNGTRTSSGTSMSTPTAAATAGIIQQMVEQGWISTTNSQFTTYPIEYLGGGVGLSEGFTPSNSLIRSLLALSADPLLGGEYRGVSFSEEPNQMKGWGRPNLSNLVNSENILQEIAINNYSIPANDIWVHDSFQLTDNDWVEQLTNRVNESGSSGGPLDKLANAPWNGNDSVGPFLSTGQNVSWILERSSMEDDLDVRLSWNAKPSPHPVDDLQLIVKFPNGSFVIGDKYRDGESQIYVDDSYIDLISQNNETTLGVKVSAEILGLAEWVQIEVRARNITIGGSPNSVGMNGDKVGFAIAAKGIRTNRIDSDGDNIPDMEDICLQTQINHSVDENGCADYEKDSDDDGVTDDVDLCEGWDDSIDRDEDGIIDGCDDDYDTDGDGVYNNVDLCQNTPLNDSINEVGCYPNYPLWAAWKFNTPAVHYQDNILLIRFLIVDNDEPANESMVWVNITSNGSTIFLCNDECNVDIVLLWNIFDYNSAKNNRNYSISLEWVEYDIDGFQINSGKGNSKDINIEYNWIITKQDEKIGKININGVWFSILTISIVLGAAIAQIWRGAKKDDVWNMGAALYPFFEEE